jgi:Domain of unknown function (DUF6371)
MNNYRFKLEKGSKKHICPACNKRSLVRYIDTTAGQLIPERYGRCDHENKCTYHLSPYKDGYSQETSEKELLFNGSSYNNGPDYQKPIIQERYFLPGEVLDDTYGSYDINTFVQNLWKNVKYPFDIDDIAKVIQIYRIGTISSGYRKGATTFPFIDKNSKIRAIQVKTFDQNNRTSSTDFIHSIIGKEFVSAGTPFPEWLVNYKKNEKYVSCLFGEHLLNEYPNNPIILVEAPKTAIYGTLYFGAPTTPKSFIWLAVFNKSSFTFDRIKVLINRSIAVFPDLSKDGSTFNEWSDKAKHFESMLPNTKFIMSDLLETKATIDNRQNGLDIADLLISKDWKQFR